MAEIRQVENSYAPMAAACAKLYFAMEDLAQIHFLYHFSLKIFLYNFRDVLERESRSKKPSKDGESEDDTQNRIIVLSDAVFTTVYKRVCDSLLHEDQLTFGLRLAFIRLSVGLDDVRIEPSELDFLLKGDNNAVPTPVPKVGLNGEPLLGLNDAQWGLAKFLDGNTSEDFKGISNHFEQNRKEWSEYVSKPAPERESTSPWSSLKSSSD